LTQIATVDKLTRCLVRAVRHFIIKATGYVRQLVYSQNMREVFATLEIFRGKKLLLANIDNILYF